MTVDSAAVADMIAELAAADDRTFRAEVDSDLRPRASAGDPRHWVRRAALRSPDLVDRWLTTLLMMSKSVEGQLASKQEDHEAEKARLRIGINKAEQSGNEERIRKARTAWESAKQNYAIMRGDKLRFKTGLDEWIVEARGLRDSLRAAMYDSIVAEERNYYAERARDLRQAIAEHKDKILDDEGYEASDADERLWSCLD